MSKNYFIYPCETLRVTQSYTGTTSHLPHTLGDIKDYPWDEGCKDGGRDRMLCGCDKMKIVKIYGVGNRGTNTIWLESTTKVDCKDGTRDYVTLMVTHPNDDDLKQLKVGQTFKRGQKICREGMDGATGNHFHFSIGKGKMKGSGWAKNNRGKWVLTTTRGTFKPEDIMYVDPKLTTVVRTLGMDFKNLPKETSKPSQTKQNTSKYTTGNYIVDTALLNVRTGPSTKYPKLKFNQLTQSAKAKILKITNGKKKDGYVRGLTFTVYKVDGEFGYTPSGCVCLKYCIKTK